MQKYASIAGLFIYIKRHTLISPWYYHFGKSIFVVWVHAITATESTTLTHWGRVTHICVSKLTIIGSDNGLSPGRHQAIIWTNAGILLIKPLATNFSEILIEIQTFSLTKMHLKMSSVKRWPFCLGLNVLKWHNYSVQFGCGPTWHNSHLVNRLSVADVESADITPKSHVFVKIIGHHWIYVTWASWLLNPLASGLFVQNLVSANNKLIIKAPHYKIS